MSRRPIVPKSIFVYDLHDAYNIFYFDAKERKAFEKYLGQLEVYADEAKDVVREIKGIYAALDRLPEVRREIAKAKRGAVGE